MAGGINYKNNADGGRYPADRGRICWRRVCLRDGRVTRRRANGGDSIPLWRGSGAKKGLSARVCIHAPADAGDARPTRSL